MLAELTSTEQIFTETSRLEPLKNVQKEGIFDCRDSFILGDQDARDINDSFYFRVGCHFRYLIKSAALKTVVPLVCYSKCGVARKCDKFLFFVLSIVHM